MCIRDRRITARFHLSPLGPRDTHLYIRHRMQVAGAQRNPFKRGAMNALYQRSQGIPRLINIIADRALIAAFVKERTDVSAAMVHQAANEVQLGEKQVRRSHWPWLAAVAAVMVAAVLVTRFSDWSELSPPVGGPGEVTVTDLEQSAQLASAPVETALTRVQETEQETQSPPLAALDMGWLEQQQPLVWHGLAETWGDVGAAFAIQASCNGEQGRGYACLEAEGSWAKIKRLNLPVIVVLQRPAPSYLLLRGLDDERLLVGPHDFAKTVSKASVDALWFGKYLVAWPQAPGWPAEVSRGDDGPAVTTILEMASRVTMPYHGGRTFDAAFESWLKDFQVRNGLKADGIVGRNTLLHLMTSSIEDPQLLKSWE